MQQHSLSWGGKGDTSGNSPSEDFADMLIGWAFDRFADDPAGVARNDFMNGHMSDWITYATEPFQETWLGSQP
jgi:hypothetical protein